MSLLAWARLIFALALPAAAASAWLRRGAVGGGAVLRGALGFVVGAAASSLTFSAWRALGGVDPAAYVALDVLLFAGLGLAALARRGPREGDEVPRLEGTGPAGLAAGVAVGVSAALALAGWIVVSRVAPLGDWDAWAMWNTRARFLFLARAPDAFWLPTELHPDYPLLLPASVARLFAYAGGVTPAAPAALAIAFSLSTAGLLWVALRRTGGVRAGTATLLLLGTSTWLWVARSQYADIPLSALLLALAVLLADAGRAPRAGRRLAALAFAGFCAGAAAWTKNEGALYLCAVGAVWILAGRLEAPRLPAAGALLAGAAAPLLATVLHKLAQRQNEIVAAVGAGSLARAADPARLEIVAIAFWRELSSFGRGAVFAALAASLLLGLPPGTRRPRWLLGSVGLALAGFVAVFLATPHPLEWHLSTSLPRLLAQAWPLALYALFACEPVRAEEGWAAGPGP